MNTLQIITLVIFGIEFVALVIALFSSQRLFNTLKKKYPEYYKQIGEPMATEYTNYSSAWSDYVRRLRGANFSYALAFRGIPTDFPKDDELRKLAHFMRYLLLHIVVLFILVAALSYYFYSQDMAP
jgi:hypothetical protein